VRSACAIVLACALSLSAPALTLAAPADPDPVERAQALLEEAAAALDDASAEEDRLAAIGRAVSAHESALSALRAGLRVMASRERGMTAEIDAEAGHLARLLAALESVARAPQSVLLAVRGGPVEAARAALLLAGVTPELDRRVAALTDRLRQLSGVRARQEEASQTSRRALAVLQDLRAATAEALGRRDRAGLASRADLRRQAVEAASHAEDLGALAGKLRSADIVLPAGTLAPGSLPVAGEVTGGFGAPDPWGRPGHGWSIEAPAFAQVTAPWDGTIRYAGPLIDYGQVVVLEPAADYLLVLAGLARIDREAGEAVLAGERLGDMGGPLPTGDQFLLEAATLGGQIRRETLYLEIRQSGKPLDPAEWFDRTQSEASR